MINVKTGEFYGPFDLLLDLIKKSKYDIYQVKLSDITNEYIDSINTMDIPIDETADFILIASQLLYIKTKALIKDTVEIEDDDEDLVDEDELLRRLIEYRKIKLVIPFFIKQEKEGSLKFTKLQEDLSAYQAEENDIVYDINKLEEALNILIENILSEDEFKIDQIINRDEYSLEKYSQNIKIKLIEKKLISISKMLSKVKKKSEAIVIFLAILELSKNKNLNIIQDEETKEIIVKLRENFDKEDLEEEKDGQ